MLSAVDCYVIARESNVVRVDFSRDPDRPPPCFPGANGLRLSDTEDEPTEVAIRAAVHGSGSRCYSATSGGLSTPSLFAQSRPKNFFGVLSIGAGIARVCPTNLRR